MKQGGFLRFEDVEWVRVRIDWDVIWVCTDWIARVGMINC